MKHYFYNDVELPGLPDPFMGASPMTDELFLGLGGMITDDGEQTPQERVCGAFADLIADLAQKTDRITPAEFLAAAQNGISSELITLARSRGVQEAVISEGRARIVEIMADALRFGVSWAELIGGGCGA